MNLRPKPVVLVVVIALAWIVSLSGSAAAFPVPGGSNYGWYQVDRLASGACNREPYGVVANFANDPARALIVRQLGQMIQSGQQRLRIGIFHGRGLKTGTVLDSSGGDLSPQNRANLAGLLAAVKAAGFAEIEVAFHPVGPNWAPGWTAWDEGLFLENWSLIQKLRPIIRGAGLHYRIDLNNEGVPAPSQPVLLQYAQRLWASYTNAFGRDDTVGFSVIGDEPARIARIPEVYGDTPPYLFDFHFYGGQQGDEYSSFVAAHNVLARLGYRQGLIIGEAFYNDPIAAGKLKAAIGATGRTVYYLTQWPLSRARTCPQVDVSSPTAFDAYVKAGFGLVPQTPPPTPGPPSPPRTGQPGPRPVPTLGKRTLRADRRGRVAFAVGCRATTRCHGTLALRVRQPHAACQALLGVARDNRRAAGPTPEARSPSTPAAPSTARKGDAHRDR